MEGFIIVISLDGHTPSSVSAKELGRIEVILSYEHDGLSIRRRGQRDHSWQSAYTSGHWTENKAGVTGRACHPSHIFYLTFWVGGQEKPRRMRQGMGVGDEVHAVPPLTGIYVGGKIGDKILDPFDTIGSTADELALSQEFQGFGAGFTWKVADCRTLGLAGKLCVWRFPRYGAIVEGAGLDALPPLLRKASSRLNGQNSSLWKQVLTLPNVLRKKAFRVIL